MATSEAAAGGTAAAKVQMALTGGAAGTGSRRAAALRQRFGPWALVTGASDGLGLAIAGELAAAGLNLILVARRGEALEAIARDLRARTGVQVAVMALDLARSGDVERLIADSTDRDIGLLVAAAGFGSSGPLVDGDVAVELGMVDVNCKAVLALSHAFARRLTARGRGGLVLFGSLVGWQGAPFSANYAATKAYVQSLAEALRIELKPAGVDVLAVAPGPVASGFARRADMVMNGATPAAVAARAVVAALAARRGGVVPGGLGKFLTASLLCLPRSLRVGIMARIMRGMTKHHGQAAKNEPA